MREAPLARAADSADVSGSGAPLGCSSSWCGGCWDGESDDEGDVEVGFIFIASLVLVRCRGFYPNNKK